ncbi:NADH:flavin oxidoreductase [Roseibium denhamense]|uniref:2,4-dienoyl-CoA reductase n=1 Tax=Roseibium denhamense TaxID=76305 RepID=A0ABY1P1Z1_9HYPH|nr:NADH:flavin oxidoreductase [Roseibium denhamense]MTI07576.1 NADH:flavin oxidoreductase [Roseibium denhamense]SMP23909.1 2,4-dienoyl-CoA reductase [Roseibium denhamense]
MSHSSLFNPFRLASIPLKNRVLVAPMTRVSATDDGCVSDLMFPYYRSFAEGGFGAVITEGVYTDKAFSQGYRYQPGLADIVQAAGWSKLIGQVQAAGARVIVQLMHAGALSQYNPFKADTRGPSPVVPKGRQMAFYRGTGAYPAPQELVPSEIDAVLKGFADAARRAQDAGADGVEVHGANGYLLDQFLTDYTNQRKDAYGGNTLHRVRLTCEAIERVREATGPAFAVGVRISQGKVNDFEHKWAAAEDDARIIFPQLAKAGASYIHTTEFQADAPAFASGYPLARLARLLSGLPVIANGGLGDPAHASRMLADENADLVALGKSALASPDWPKRVQEKTALSEFSFDMFSPLADLETANAYEAERAARLHP